jgi:hypothetical protein
MDNPLSNVKPLDVKHIIEPAREAAIYIDQRRKGIIKSLITPWSKYNGVAMGGIEWNTIHTIGGRSGSGKTAILNQLETELGFLNPQDNFDILSFNFEMLARNLVGRKFASRMNKTTKELYSGGVGESLSDEDYARVIEAGREISKLNVFYVEHSGTVPQIELTIHNHIARRNADDPNKGLVVLLDHTILVLGKQGDLERIVLMELMTMFNRLKKLYKIAFVLLTQLNRDIESSDRMTDHTRHFPLRKDIFGGDMVYQFSDVVMVSMNPEQMGLQSYGPHNWPVEGYVYWHFLNKKFSKNEKSTYLCTMIKLEQKIGKPAIYKIVNTHNNKLYVGSCVGHYVRKGQHYYRLRKGTHDNNHLQSAWNLYGEESFVFDIIEFVQDVHKLIEREQYWIDTLNVCNRLFGYNKAPMAGSNLGRKMSIESRLKMSSAKKGIKQNPETVKQRAESSQKTISCFSKEGKFISSFASRKEAGGHFNINPTTISKVLKNNGVNKTAGKMIWKYGDFTEKSV